MESNSDETDASLDEGLYPMRMVERLTGLSADTIRAWEKRYGAVRPARTDGRARRYSEAEVRRLSLLREAVDNGHSIGSIGRLDEDALLALAKRSVATLDLSPPEGVSSEVGEYLAAIERYDLRHALDLVTRRAALLEPRELCLRFLQPVLEEIGLRWERGDATVIHEHIVSTHVKMVLGIYSRLAVVASDAPKVAFLTPEGHAHEFGIHIGAILATTRGVEPIVLGPDVPYALLADFDRVVHPKAYVFGVSREFSLDELTRFRRVVESLAAKADVWIGCPRTSEIALRAPPSARTFHDFATFDDALANLAR